MKFLTVIIATLISSLTLAATPGPVKSLADIHEKNNPEAPKLLYKQTREVKREGDKYYVKKEFTTPDGVPQVLEEFWYKDDKCVQMKLTQHQLNTKGGFEVKEGKVHFTYEKVG